jgi:hypothetical protein
VQTLKRHFVMTVTGLRLKFGSMAPGNSGERFMGLRSINVGGREALEFTCDCAAHRGEPATAWFDCGSDLGNVELALAAGWRERRVKRTWLCPQCAHKAASKALATADQNAA